MGANTRSKRVADLPRFDYITIYPDIVDKQGLVLAPLGAGANSACAANRLLEFEWRISRASPRSLSRR
jgi:hypothetical protein